jgi:hypothetical protein
MKVGGENTPSADADTPLKEGNFPLPTGERINKKGKPRAIGAFLSL